MLPLHARQAVRHWFRFFLVGHHRQKAVHRSGRAAQAVFTPSVLSAAPAKTSPMLRSDSRRDTDTASSFDKSSRRSMMDTFLLEENGTQRAIARSPGVIRLTDAAKATRAERADISAAPTVLWIFWQVHADPGARR